VVWCLIVTCRSWQKRRVWPPPRGSASS